jgi:hypothetical protein
MANDKDVIQFRAVKYKYVDDEDGEGLLTLRVSMQDKISAFAIPVKKILEVVVKTTS